MSQTRSLVSSLLFLSCLAACNGGGGDRVSMTLVPSDYSRVRVATYDSVTGAVVLAGADLDDGASHASTDAVPVRFGGTSGVLLRDVGQLAVLGDDGLTVVRRIDLNDAGDTMSSNPQGVVSVSSTKAYVPRLAKNSLLIIDPSKSGAAAQLGTVDLSTFLETADVDGHVDMTAAVRLGSRVYVALGRYYFDATFAIHYPGPSMLAVIDTTTDTLVDTDGAMPGVQGITLEQRGPVALAAANGRVYVASNGAYGMADGGVEVVDGGTFSTRSLVSEATLTPMMASVGDLSGVVFAGGQLVVVAADRAVVVDPESGAPGATLVGSGAMGVVATSGATVVVGESGTMKVFDVADGMDETPSATPATFDMSLMLAAIAGG